MKARSFNFLLLFLLAALPVWATPFEDGQGNFEKSVGALGDVPIVMKNGIEQVMALDNEINGLNQEIQALQNQAQQAQNAANNAQNPNQMPMGGGGGGQPNGNNNNSQPMQPPSPMAMDPIKQPQMREPLKDVQLDPNAYAFHPPDMTPTDGTEYTSPGVNTPDFTMPETEQMSKEGKFSPAKVASGSLQKSLLSPIQNKGASLQTANTPAPPGSSPMMGGGYGAGNGNAQASGSANSPSLDLKTDQGEQGGNERVTVKNMESGVGGDGGGGDGAGGGGPGMTEVAESEAAAKDAKAAMAGTNPGQLLVGSASPKDDFPAGGIFLVKNDFMDKNCRTATPTLQACTTRMPGTQQTTPETDDTLAAVRHLASVSDRPHRHPKKDGSAPASGAAPMEAAIANTPPAVKEMKSSDSILDLVRMN